VTIRFGTEIAAAAAAHHVDPRLLAAVAAQETGGPGSNSGNNVLGDGGHGHGVFQIDDRYWAFARTPAAMIPAKNANVAAGILGDNLHRFGGNIRAALSAYNAGSPAATGTLTRWADGKVLGYADSVMRHYGALGGSTEQIAADTRAALPVVDALHGAARAQAAPGGGFAVPLRGAPAALPPGSTGPAGLTAGGGVGALLAALATTVHQALAAHDPAALPAPPPAAPLQPLTTWTQLSAASSNETAAADKSVADLVDAGDVFGDHDEAAGEL